MLLLRLHSGALTAKGVNMRTLEVAAGDGGNRDDWQGWEDEVKIAREQGDGVRPVLDVGGMKRVGGYAASGAFAENFRSEAVVPRAGSPIVLGRTGMGNYVQFGP